MQSRRWTKQSDRQPRRAAAAVEFAVMVPLFLMLVMGTWEMGSALTAGTKMAAAVREGGRLASMDYEESLGSGQTANQKVEQDIKNFLTASSIPGDVVTVTITHADGPTAGQTFNLQDPANYLKLFRITATVEYEDISSFPMDYMAGESVEASLVFRMGRVSLGQ
jgi:Flp pilus assembly protein TadG